MAINIINDKAVNPPPTKGFTHFGSLKIKLLGLLLLYWMGIVVPGVNNFLTGIFV